MAAKTNSNGFIRLENEFCHGAVWLGFTLGARCLLIQIWSWHNGFNNGGIGYSVNQAMRDLRCGKSSAIRYFAELKGARAIEVITRGGFTNKTGAREGRASTWRITLIPGKDDKVRSK